MHDKTEPRLISARLRNTVFLEAKYKNECHFLIDIERGQMVINMDGGKKKTKIDAK